jgi:hypothetical protein
LIGHLWNAGHGVPESNVAINPRFCDSSDLMLYNLPVGANATLAKKADLQDLLSNTLDKVMQQARPNGAGYVNEVIAC